MTNKDKQDKTKPAFNKNAASKGKPYPYNKGKDPSARSKRDRAPYDKGSESKGFDKGRAKVERLHIDKLDDDFAGVAYIGDQRYVVKGALVGEDVLAQEEVHVGNIHLCRTKRVLSPSLYRVPQDCHIKGCGGCSLRYMDYRCQLDAKTALVKRKLHDFYQGEVAPCIAGEGGRNKVHLVFGTQESGGKTRVTVGFFDAETHAVLDAPVCLAHGRWYPAVVNTLRAWAQRSGNSVYRPDEKVGDLRFAVIRRLSSGMMVTIVSRREPKNLRFLHEDLCRLSPRVSLWYNHNDQETNEVFSSQFHWVAGPKELQGEMLSVTFSLSPDSFFQTNTASARTAYRKVQQWVGNRPVLDLFCGIGITSVMFAQNGCSVHSVESSPSAVEDLRKMAQQNGVADRITPHLGLVSDILPTLPVTEGEAIFVDPPRAGLGEQLCRQLVARQADVLVYMSCSVRTLAQDLAILCQAYQVTEVQPLDMFPFTKHVETVVKLSRQ